MARVTVEDCIEKVPNRFQLVMLAAQRARDLSVGAEITVDRDNDKNPVVALREIADGTVGLDDLEEGLVLGMQKHADTDDPEEEAADQLALEEELAATAEAASQVGVAAATFDAEGDEDFGADDVDEDADLDIEEPDQEAE